MTNCAVVVATGSPRHKSQLIYNRPRAMLPALGKPLVARLMDRLLRAGISRFVVIIGTDEGGVASYLHDHWVPNAEVNFVLLPQHGTLPNAIGEAAARLGESFLLCGYNSFLHQHVIDRLQATADDYNLTLVGTNAPLSDTSGGCFALLEGDQVSALTVTPTAGAYTLANVGHCTLEFALFAGTLTAHDHPETVQIADIFRLYVQPARPAHLIKASWTLQVESDHDLIVLHRHLLEEEDNAYILSEIPGSVQIVPPVRIDPRVNIGRGARIGPYAYLESGCSIGAGAVIENAVIMANVNVPLNAHINGEIVATRARILA